MHDAVIALDALRRSRSGTMLVEPPQPADGAEAGRAARHRPRTRLVVWGAGAMARGFVGRLAADVVIVAHVDSDETRWGTRFEGHPVVGPEALRTLTFDLLVIASSFVAEIRSRLAGLGLADSVPTVEWAGPFDGWRYPSLFDRQPMAALQVGITTRCNLLCKHCPRDLDERVYHDVDLATFRRYLSAFDPTQFHTLLVSDFGEVTVVKTFLAYLRTARELGWERVEFVTNATNGKPELWQAIFSEGLARKIVISLEGTGTAFEAVRGFPWERFARNVGTIAEAIARHGQPAELVLNAVCMRSNLRDLPAIVDFAARHRAMLSFVHLNPSNLFNNPLGQADNHLDQAPREDVVAVFREVVRRATLLGVTVGLPEEFPELAERPAAPAHSPTENGVPRLTGLESDLVCTQPLKWVEVGSNGDVFPCCQMSKRYPVGNIAQQSFDQIWHGDGYRRLLEGLRPGGTPVDVCRTCNLYLGKNF